MNFFLSTPDPQFFDDIRKRIAMATEDLKLRRKKQSQKEKRIQIIPNPESDLDPDLNTNTVKDMTNLLRVRHNRHD